MSPQLVRTMLAGFACLARVEAMKAANEARARHGFAQAYDEEQFFAEAKELDLLAQQAGEIQ